MYRFKESYLIAILGATGAQNVSTVCKWLLNDQYIRSDLQHFAFIGGEASFALEFKGWQRFYELQKAQVNSNLAFMAMPFGSSDLDDVYYSWFKPACKAVGFDLRRVDERPEAGLINNKMLVDIRKSRFVIAELSQENRGVYWEAGFAEGLGRPVIYTCDKSYQSSNPLHFDIRQHHTVFWKADFLQKAAEDLIITIQATIPDSSMIDVDKINWEELRGN